MWQVDNRTPFAADRAWVRDRDGAEVWLVVVKATFDIAADGTTTVSRVQPPVLHAAEPCDGEGRGAIKYDADLVLTKATTDVVVVGHAYAPPGRQVDQLDIGLEVGPLKKVLRVFGDRRWGAFGMSSPVPFTSMPLTYDRAFGGVDRRSATPERDWDWRNPVGRGFAVSARNADGLPLPNLEDPRRLIGSWDDRPAPAGFGAVAGHWQPRVGYAGTYDEHWMKTRQPLLAEDLDDRFYQCAPVDQQTPTFLQGGESVALHRLTPEGSLTFVLPRLHLGFETRFFDGSREIHKVRRLHTVILEPDHPRVSLVWHSALPCHFKVQKLDRTLVTQKARVETSRSVDDPVQPERA